MNKNQQKNNTNEEPECQYQVFVGGCHPDMTEDKLTEVFGKYGEIEQIRMKIDKLTGIFYLTSSKST